MANFIFCVCMFRIALPLLITTCIAFRPSVLSGVYLLFLLYSSVVPVPTEQSMAGHTSIYLKLLIAVSVLTALLQVAFHSILLAVPTYREMLEASEFWEKLLRYLGFVRLNSADAVTVTTWISPEIIMLLSSIAIYMCCSKLTRRIASPIVTEEGEATVKKHDVKKKFSFWISLGKYLTLASLCFAAVLRPSVQGGFYFLIFLMCATWWACYKELQKGFAIVLRIVAFVVLAHILVLYSYQFDFFQEFLGQNSTYARYFALTPIVSNNETDPRQFHFNHHEWATYVNPLALLWLFFMLIIVSKHLLKPKLQKKQGAFSRLEGSFNGPLNRQMSQRLSDRRIMRSGTTRHRWQSATRKVRVHVNADRDTLNENTPLIRGVSPSRKYGAGSKKTATIFQDSTGSVTVTASDDIPMRQLEEDEDTGPTCCDNLLYAMESILLFIIRTSYIATNIIMMTWSITYHSWLTFVLLLWANILWMIPNQRRAMLKSSPFLVFYAWFLLISAYIYSMNLTEDELPSEIKNVNLAQIGFVKYMKLPCNPLLVKCLFTMMFWITLRQYMKERKEAKQNSALADMIAPLQVTVGTAAGVNKEEKAENKTLKKLGQFIQKFLTKFWIWIVAITLFTVAITGERMTGFRILYMALFLIFILTFQISFKVWRKMMFGFWLVVIIYSMLVLILVYTYQFDNFKDYWTTYLHVPIEQQLDIGLEKFETPQLFVRLVTPTFFVIIIVVQLHYFHKDFMEITTPREASVNPTSEEDSSVQGRVIDKDKDLDSNKTDNVSDLKLDLTDLANISSTDWKKKVTSVLKKIQEAIDLTFLFFEIHMQRFVLFFAMLLCIYDACALHLVIILFVILGATSGRRVQMFAILASSVYISVLLLAKMVYQIQYIQHDMWNVSCEVDNATNLTANSAEWLGFNKTAHGRDLPYIVRWNISYILIVTLFCILIVWQDLRRASLGKPPGRVFFMFPQINHSHANKDLKSCLMYLVNYGYYRFGVEMSLIMTVILIGFRMDAYAVLYAVWLCILFSLSRSALARIWNIYLFFIAFLLIVQYVMLVGLPPGLCLLYPWDDKSTDTMHRIQNWAFLMSNTYPLSAKKLICDVFLLLFVSRQAVAFRIETRYKGKDYPGGSNESIIHHAEEKNFANPMPDFITFTRTYLDVVKRVILLGFMWVTLAIVFLAGANRVNLFSLGYLVGSFMFLWQGGDFYLRPIPKILNSWNWLLGYNVLVIMIKACLQLVGCVFIHEVEKYACWIVQLLAIGCVRKFADATELQSLKSDCTVPREYIGLAWDGACFGFLLLQRRIFNSFNFFHIIDETKASTILASRGAELIEQLRHKRMYEQDEVERKVLEKIKAKMDRIKATQQKMQGPNYVASTNHFVDQPPLVRSSSASSCSSARSEQTPEGGYHTPIDEDDELPPLTPAAGSLLQTQAPSPYSAIMTVSLEGYLEPQRMSFSSPPNSELNPRQPSPDDSFPVFSPPPYDAAPPYAEAVNRAPVSAPHRQINIGPPWMQGSLITPRQSIISGSPRSPLSHHTYHIYPKSRPLYRRSLPEGYKEAIRSGDYYMFDELDDEDLDFFDKAVRSSSQVEDDEDDEERKLRRTSSSRKRTIGELLSTAMKTDLTTTLRGSEDEVKRRASMPLARQRSSVSARSQMSVPLSAPPIIEEGRRREHVEFVETEPKPGTSKEDQEISELSEPRESKCQKVVNVFLFIWAIIDSTMVSCVNFLNKYSKDYRYVVRVLKKEKKLLKETTDYTSGIRVGQLQMWQPTGSYHTLLHKARAASVLELTPTVGTCSPSDSYRAGILVGRAAEAHNSINSDSDEKPPLSDSSENKALMSPAVPCSPEKDRRKASVLTVPEIRILAPSLERGLDSPFPGSTQEYLEEHLDEFDPGELSSYDQPTIFRLVLAIWYIIVSHSDILCYFVIFLNEIKSATFISLPLVLFVFLWGTLTIPRPSKTFWVTIIAYTQTIVVIKCLFQFEIFEWNANPISVSPFYPPTIIGIERKKNYALWDLLLLLIVFFHRYILKSLGLWKTTFIPTYVIPDGEYTVEEEKDKKSEQRRSSHIKHRKNYIPGIYYYKAPKRFFLKKSKRPILLRLQLEEPPPKTGRSSPNSRRSSDLQRLVEESEDTTEEDSKRYDSKGQLVKVTTTENSVSRNFPDTLQITSSKYLESAKSFFKQLLDPTSRVAADVYSYMFLCDFFNFFVLLIGYSSFGPQQGADTVSSYLVDNRVPTLFLLMLITQFLLIVIDRAIFLRKNILAKIVFQFLQVVILHVWLFIIYPIVTEKQFNAVLAPQMYYMVKCFYLLLSAYQIRCGYPSRILGNFLCKGYGYVNMFLFKGFMLIPFLFELRTVMDWMWTDTSMTVFDWIKMEDIFAHIFQLKCTRHVEDEYPQPRGERKKPIVKYLMGGGLLLIICIIIWFPLIFFSLGNAVGIVNVPSDVTMDIRIGAYEPVYQLSAQSYSIFSFNVEDMKDFQKKYNKNKAAAAFISNYEHSDIAAIKLSRDSASVWSISPPDRKRMIDEVKSQKPLSVRLSYAITHQTNSKEDSGIIREEIAVTLEAVVNGKPSVPRQNLLKMLEGGNETDVSPVLLGYLLPKFLKVTSRGTAKPIEYLMDADPDPEASSLRTLVLILSNSPTKSDQEWWEIQENCTDHNYITFLQNLPRADCESILMYTFNDRVFPATLSIITAGGIIGLYTTLVFVASRVLRGFFAEICFKIMFDDMPNVDRVLQLCLDIYLVREAREFSLEEDLFAKLVFLFRSPETLIKWTRPKEEIGDEEDPEGDPE